MEQVNAVIREGLAGHPKVKIHCAANPSPHVLSLQVDYFRSEVLLHTLSDREIYVSSGSACSSHSGKSPVLQNFGLTPKEADQTIRLSFSGMNTVAEGEEFVKILREILR
jgi:cysteine desulfurase